MKRFYSMVVCAALLSIPVSPAMAGTWSWHSELVEKITEMIENHTGGSSDEGTRQDENRRPNNNNEHRAATGNEGRR